MTAAKKILSVDATVVAGPPFKWLGGKRKLLSELESRLPATFGHYHEPFVGGGALFWRLAALRRLHKDRVSLSDTCVPLVRTFRALKSNAGKVIELLGRMPITKTHFMAIRSISKTDRDELRDEELAAWFIYLNKTSFNGLFRVNKADVFNTPWGSYKNPTTCNAELLQACGAVLRRLNVSVTDRPFEDVLHYAQKGDLIYFDPPYMPSSPTSDFTSYTKERFDYNAHVKLRDVAFELKSKGMHVMISNSDVPLVREIYASRPSFRIEVVHAPRSINSKGDGRGVVRELIIR
jgi:DNA adenine methylase